MSSAHTVSTATGLDPATTSPESLESASTGPFPSAPITPSTNAKYFSGDFLGRPDPAKWNNALFTSAVIRQAVSFPYQLPDRMARGESPNTDRPHFTTSLA